MRAILKIKKSDAVDPDYSCRSHECFGRNVLMPVQKKLGLHTIDVRIECVEAQMYVVLSVMDFPWRIMSNKNIDCGKP